MGEGQSGKEIEQWADLQREADLLGGASNETNENTPFTPEEQKEIVERLQELAEYARRTYSLSGPEMQILNAKLDYLIVGLSVTSYGLPELPGG